MQQNESEKKLYMPTDDNALSFFSGFLQGLVKERLTEIPEIKLLVIG